VNGSGGGVQTLSEGFSKNASSSFFDTSKNASYLTLSFVRLTLFSQFHDFFLFFYYYNFLTK
jgi:hypothetical protein